MKLSVLLPITGENRKYHLEACLHFLNTQTLQKSNYEIVLVEQVNALLGGKKLGGPFYNNIKNIDKYIAIKDPGDNHFNQPWMENVGARVATGNKFLFYDIDLACDNNYLKAVYEFKAPYFIAWDRMIAMNKDNSKTIKSSLRITKDLKNGAKIHKSGVLDYAGFSVCAGKHFFFNVVGCYNENYLGWGGNDNDIAWRALKILGKEYKFNYNLYHMYHEKGYANSLLWKRRDVWRTTYKHPNDITNRLKQKNLGNLKKQTFINIDDIKVDSYKEHLKKRKINE